MKVQAASVQHLGWLAERVGVVMTPDAKAIEAIDHRGVIAGMVAYDHWTENSAVAHMAVSSPIAWRCMLVPAFSYAFQQAGKGVLLGFIRESNTRSLRFAKKIGFRQTHIVADGYSVGDGMVMVEMRKEDCRWIAKEGA